MDQALLMGVLQADGRLADQFAGVGDAEPADIDHQVGEVQSVDVLDGQVRGRPMQSWA